MQTSCHPAIQGSQIEEELPSFLQFTIPIPTVSLAFKWIIALPAPNAASDGNSNCLRPKMRAKKCGKEVKKVSVSPPSTPIKLSHNDGGIDVNRETLRKSQVKFSPKVIASSPTTNMTADPTTPPPYSGGRRGDSNVKSSCRRRLDFGSACIQTTTMLIYTKGGFCFTRKVRKRNPKSFKNSQTRMQFTKINQARECYSQEEEMMFGTYLYSSSSSLSTIISLLYFEACELRNFHLDDREHYSLRMRVDLPLRNVSKWYVVKKFFTKLDGGLFYEIYCSKLHRISEMSPDCVKSVDLHDGEWGVVGSTIVWNFMHDGKAKMLKEVIEVADDEKMFLCKKVIGGELMDAYKTFLVTIHVETKGKENLVTWTFHYEKLNENIEDPNTLMDLCISVTKDIENFHLAN
ncbi:hypothetical protein L1887_34803 [Cichorium endivia]|nr:hypothetical protein L1887_34803 [Cichorium endivia]